LLVCISAVCHHHRNGHLYLIILMFFIILYYDNYLSISRELTVALSLPWSIVSLGLYSPFWPSLNPIILIFELNREIDSQTCHNLIT
jgi:hypothetical protein